MSRLKVAEDEKPAFTAFLGQLNLDIAQGDRQPVGMWVHIHYADGGLVRAHRMVDGFNRLLALGGFECSKADLLQWIAEDT